MTPDTYVWAVLVLALVVNAHIIPISSKGFPFVGRIGLQVSSKRADSLTSNTKQHTTTAWTIAKDSVICVSVLQSDSIGSSTLSNTPFDFKNLAIPRDMDNDMNLCELYGSIFFTYYMGNSDAPPLFPIYEIDVLGDLLLTVQEQKPTTISISNGDKSDLIHIENLMSELSETSLKVLIIGKGKYLQHFSGAIDIFWFSDSIPSLATLDYPLTPSSRYFTLDNYDNSVSTWQSHCLSLTSFDCSQQTIIRFRSSAFPSTASSRSMMSMFRILDIGNSTSLSAPLLYSSIWDWLSGVLISTFIAVCAMVSLGYWLVYIQTKQSTTPPAKKKEFGYIDEDGVISLGELDVEASSLDLAFTPYIKKVVDPLDSPVNPMVVADKS